MNHLPSWWQTNLTLLQLREPFSHASLSSIKESHIPLPENPLPEQALASKAHWVFQIGLGRQSPPLPDTTQQIWVIEPIPELTWQWWQHVDYHEWLIHPGVHYICMESQDVLKWLYTQLAQLPQLAGVAIEIEPSYQVTLTKYVPHLISGLLHLQAQISQCQDLRPPELAQQIKALYQELEPIGKTVLDAYPGLSCRNGCSDCCQSGCGWTLLLRPGEWLVMWECMQVWHRQHQRDFFEHVLDLLKQHHALLTPLWEWSIRDPSQLKQQERMQEVLPLLKPVLMAPCPMLDTHQRCLVYAGRPLVCRLFGQSHWDLTKPFTCNRDWETQLHILKQEQFLNQLIPAQEWFYRLKLNHQHNHYYQILLFWLLAHMDIEHQRWLEHPSLDWHIFERLSDKFEKIRLI